eukprot:Gb_07581 [translate_table: standard]
MEDDGSEEYLLKVMVIRDFVVVEDDKGLVEAQGLFFVETSTHGCFASFVHGAKLQSNRVKLHRVYVTASLPPGTKEVQEIDAKRMQEDRDLSNDDGRKSKTKRRKIL